MSGTQYAPPNPHLVERLALAMSIKPGVTITNHRDGLFLFQRAQSVSDD